MSHVHFWFFYGYSEIEQAMEALPKQSLEAKKKKPEKSSAAKANGGKKPTPSATPSQQPKIAILKRDKDSAAVETATSSASAPLASPSDLEEVLKKTLATHFKKQENFILDQVLKAVKSETQTTVVPTLSKLMTQTMEQAVVKPVKAALDKNAKERTKMQTDVIVNAVSSSVEEPLKEAFQEVRVLVFGCEILQSLRGSKHYCCYCFRRWPCRWSLRMRWRRGKCFFRLRRVSKRG